MPGCSYKASFTVNLGAEQGSTLQAAFPLFLVLHKPNVQVSGLSPGKDELVAQGRPRRRPRGARHFLASDMIVNGKKLNGRGAREWPPQTAASLQHGTTTRSNGLVALFRRPSDRP